MAEKSLFWTTNGTGDGSSGGYTATEFYDFVRRLLITDQEALQGVLKNVLNELAVSGSATPLAVASGCAICYGFYYENSASLNLTVTSPITGTTGGRVNLKVDWTAQTVRAVIQMNTDGTAAIPALVQTGGSEWNVPLATFTVTIGGVITLTDARNYCQFANYLTATAFDAIAGLSVIGRAANSVGASAAITADVDGEVLQRTGNVLEFGQVATDGLGTNIVTDGKLRQSTAMSVVGRAGATTGNVADITADVDGEVLQRTGSALEFGQVAAAGIAANAVTDPKLRQSAGLSVIGRGANTTGDVADITAASDAHVLRRSGTTLAFGQVAAAGIADNAVTLAKIAADSVDDTKAGDRVPQFYRRQGGSATDWSSPGSTAYTPTAVRMQAGMEDINLGVGVSTATVTITFPVAFSNIPVVWNTIQLRSGMNPDTTVYTPFIDSISATQVVLRITRSSTADGSVTPYIQWLAIGPE